MITKLLALLVLLQLSFASQEPQVDIVTASEAYNNLLKANAIKLAEVRERIRQNTHVNPPELQEDPITFGIEVNGEITPELQKQYLDNLAEIRQDGKKEDECTVASLRIPIMGQQADIGELYDARTDFLHIGERLWSSDKAKSKYNIITMDTPKSQYLYYTEDNVMDKMNQFELTAELQISYQSDDFSLSIGGKAEYLNSNKKNSRTARGILQYKSKTISEKVEDLSVIEYLDDQFQRKDVTHVVTGIEWGADAKVICDYQMRDIDDKQYIYGELEIVAEFSQVKISGSASLELDKESKDFSDRLSVTTIADVVVDDTLPTNVDQAIDFLQKVPEKANGQNGGKGRAQFMTLTPLCLVQKNIPKIKRLLTAAYKQMKANLLLQLMEEYRTLDSVSQNLQTLKDDFESAPKMMVGRDGFSKLERNIDGFQRFKNDKKELIKDIIIKEKSGLQDQAFDVTLELNKLKKNSEFNTKAIAQYVEDENNKVTLNIRTVNQLQNQQNKEVGTKVIHNDIHREIGDVSRSKVILFYTVKKVSQPDENFVFFQQLMRYYKPLKTDYFIVLYDLLPQNIPDDAEEKAAAAAKKSFIQYYKPAGRFRKHIKKVTYDYLNFKFHDAAVIVNPKELDAELKFYYVGQLDHDENRAGYGRVYTNGDTSKGQVENDNLANARQYLLYEGSWEKDKFNGQGVIYDDGVEKCKGKFKQGRTDGYISCIIKDGSQYKYNGPLDNLGRRHGFGTNVDDPINKPKVRCEYDFKIDIEFKKWRCYDENGLIKRDFSAIYEEIKPTKTSKFLLLDTGDSGDQELITSYGCRFADDPAYLYNPEEDNDANEDMLDTANFLSQPQENNDNNEDNEANDANELSDNFEENQIDDAGLDDANLLENPDQQPEQDASKQEDSQKEDSQKEPSQQEEPQDQKDGEGQQPDDSLLQQDLLNDNNDDQNDEIEDDLSDEEHFDPVVMSEKVTACTGPNCHSKNHTHHHHKQSHLRLNKNQ